jgi:hypothetical protein
MLPEKFPDGLSPENFLPDFPGKIFNSFFKKISTGFSGKIFRKNPEIKVSHDPIRTIKSKNFPKQGS